MSTKSIRRRICIDAKFLDKTNIMDHILQKLRDLTKNECSSEHGYILKVIEIEDIISNKISPATSEIVFEVIFKAKNIKPKIDDIFEGIVCMILQEGILLEVENKFKVLIASSKLKDYEFDKNMFKKGNKIIKKNDIVSVSIKGVDYDKHKFSCYGELVE